MANIAQMRDVTAYDSHRASTDVCWRQVGAVKNSRIQICDKTAALAHISHQELFSRVGSRLVNIGNV